MKTIFCVAVLVTAFLQAIAQEKKTEPKISISPITAQFMISTNFDAVCLNMVGTGIRYTRKNTIISITIFPTLIFREDTEIPDPGDPKRPFVRPGFAVGPMFQYKRLLLGFPTFFQDDEWHVTAGVGVKIGK